MCFEHKNPEVVQPFGFLNTPKTLFGAKRDNVYHTLFLVQDGLLYTVSTVFDTSQHVHDSNVGSFSGIFLDLPNSIFACV